MLLIFTGSLDGSANLVIHSNDYPTFRLNIDLIDQYKIVLEPAYWSIEDPLGRRIDSTNASRAWWWKAFNYGLDADSMYSEEIKYVFRELYNWFGHRNLLVGNPPDFENRFGKIAQLQLAGQSLPTLHTSLRLNVPFPMELLKSAISKPLTGTINSDGKVRQTSDVSGSPLHPKFPWLVQTLAIAQADITVLLLGDESLAYRRSRETLTGLDWRTEQLTDPQKWQAVTLPGDYQQGIRQFAQAARVNWGRLDFLELADGNWVFLEYNANGQWGFLELDCPVGLPLKVANFLCHSPTHGWPQQA
jgi:hypothetical protein